MIWRDLTLCECTYTYRRAFKINKSNRILKYITGPKEESLWVEIRRRALLQCCMRSLQLKQSFFSLQNRQAPKTLWDPYIYIYMSRTLSSAEASLCCGEAGKKEKDFNGALCSSTASETFSILFNMLWRYQICIAKSPARFQFFRLLLLYRDTQREHLRRRECHAYDWINFCIAIVLIKFRKKKLKYMFCLLRISPRYLTRLSFSRNFSPLRSIFSVS